MSLKAKHNGQLPTGYKGAREKAFDQRFAEYKKKKAAVAKPKAKPKSKAPIRALAVQPDSSNSEFTDDDMPNIIACVNGKTGGTSLQRYLSDQGPIKGYPPFIAC